MQELGTFDLGGIVLQFGPLDHQGMDDIHLTSIYPEILSIEAAEQSRRPSPGPAETND
jgi:branched-chain amino acid transport system substrate-binding protein